MSRARRLEISAYPPAYKNHRYCPRSGDLFVILIKTVSTHKEHMALQNIVCHFHKSEGVAKSKMMRSAKMVAVFILTEINYLVAGLFHNSVCPFHICIGIDLD